jgi:cysteine desulfurase / selenocysteine lyase
VDNGSKAHRFYLCPPGIIGNDALFYGVGTAIDFCTTIGFDRIFTYNQTMAERFYQGLLQIPGVEIVSPEERIYHSPMISFKMKDHGFREINEHLVKDKIRVRTVTEGGCDCIRVSFHICNHDGEVDKILDSLKRLASA